MIVQPLGTGGAFDPFETCYLVNETILIDCGPASIKKTFADGRAHKIEHVFLSHIHQDHVGGIEALTYFRKYVSKKQMGFIYCPGEYLHQAQRLACYAKNPLNLAYLAHFTNNGIHIETPYGAVVVTPIPVEHSELDAYGFKILEVATGKVLVISGDCNRPIKFDGEFNLMFHDVGSTGYPDSDHRVHPFEHEVVEAFGPDAPIINIHTSQPTAVYDDAVADKIYLV